MSQSTTAPTHHAAGMIGPDLFEISIACMDGQKQVVHTAYNTTLSAINFIADALKNKLHELDDQIGDVRRMGGDAKQIQAFADDVTNVVLLFDAVREGK